jgi:hypothetical protein
MRFYSGELMNKFAVFIAGVAAFVIPSIAHAQTGAGLLIKPWEANGAVEEATTGLLENRGHIQENQRSFQLSVLESAGRVRILPGHEASPRLGYDLTLLNMHTSQPKIHSQLLDASFAFGTFVGESNGWVFGVTMGLGYAGDSPFAEGRGWYGHADFVVAKKFSETDALGVGLDYDGHRSYMPDVPLPGFGYIHTFDPHLEMVVGAPLSSITWKPDDKWRLYLEYNLLTDFDLDIGYQFIKHWIVFGGFQTRRDQFIIQALPGHTRLLYGQKRGEAGIRFDPLKYMNFTVAFGYAFATDFRKGFDYRDTQPFFNASNVPYIRLGLDVKF